MVLLPFNSRYARLWIGMATGVLVALLMVGLWSQNYFVRTRLRMTNLYYVAQQASDNVVIVAIDDRSIREYGAYQDWSRERYAALLDQLSAGNARVAAFDLLFSEPRDGDAALAAAITDAEAAGTRVVLAAAGFERLDEADGALHFADDLRPLPMFAEPAFYTAFVNNIPDADGTVRRYTSQVSAAGDDYYSMALAAYFSYFNLSPTLAPQAVSVEENRLTLPATPPLTLTINERGLWMMNYFGDPSTRSGGTFQVYSIRDVIEGDYASAAFDGKIVLVGLMDAVGAVDQRITPVSLNGELMAGVEINANAVETMLSGVPLRPESRTSQALTIAVVAVALSLLLAQVRWQTMMILAAGAPFLWLVYASLTFSVRGVVLNLLYPLLTIVVCLVVSLGVRISLEIRQRKSTESMLKTLLQVSREQTEFDRLLTLISDDLRVITEGLEGSVWIPDSENEFVPVRTWGVNGEYPEVSRRAVDAVATQTEGRVLAVPVVWQREVRAVLTALLPPVRTGARERVEQFAAQLAVSLENARLFSETRSQNQVLQGILAESPAGIMVLDDAFNIQRYNERVAEWLEMQDRNFTGQPISAALEHSPMDRDTWKTLGTNLMKSEHFRQEIVVRKRTYQVDAAHIPLGGRWVLTLSNITDLAELSQLKTRMIRIASHDLKNPLGRILGYAELMQEMVDDEEDDLTQYNYYLSRMIHSGEDMNKIITEILDLEHLRSGNIEREPLDMINTIRDVLDRSRFDAEQKKQTLTEQLPEHLPEIMGDFTQLVQGLSNLVGNAIKYTPEGGQIDVRLYQHGDAIRFEVQDNGYGIPKEAQGRLFSEFYRVHTDNTRDIKGTGLGLSLVKAVIEAHEGRVWVDSEYNEGSTFFVELPLAPVEV